VSHAADDSSPRLDLALADETATSLLGAALAAALSPGLVVYLSGDLGAGKTTLVRGALRALGYEGTVRSPTYTLVELYATSSLDLYHFDFYRFDRPEEYLDAGLEEYFGKGAVCLVEWPERALPYVPPADLRIALRFEGKGRRAEVSGLSAAGIQCLKRIELFRRGPGPVAK
jgi:tRNA threonylcarbamoyladenosine biosynthesis protein TsaE